MKPLKIKPKAPYILVRRFEPENKYTPGGLIFLPEEQNLKNRRCEVVAVHKGIKQNGRRLACSVKPGDIVELIIFDGIQLNEGFNTLEFADEDNVLAVLTGEDTLEPLGGRVVVQEEPEKDRNEGGMIIIPDIAKKRPEEGQVLAVGPGKRRKDGGINRVCVEPGDQVLFAKFSGTKVKLPSGREVAIIDEAHIHAVFA